MLVAAPSSWLRLISKPLPLTMVVSGNRSDRLTAGLAGTATLVERAGVAAAAQRRQGESGTSVRLRTNDTDSIFINRFADFSTVLQFDHLDIADVRVALNFVQQFLRGHAIQIERR